MFFFFQAEDGIRDLTVTGVQTCALPIYSPAGPCSPGSGESAEGTPAGGRTICGSSHRGAVPLRVAGRYRKFRCRVGGISASDDSPAYDGEAMAPRSCCLTGCIVARLLAWHRTAPRTAILGTITRSNGGKA